MAVFVQSIDGVPHTVNLYSMLRELHIFYEPLAELRLGIFGVGFGVAFL